MKGSLLISLLTLLSVLATAAQEKEAPSVVTDSLVLDTVPREVRSFDASFKERYTDDTYVYEKPKKTEGWFTRSKNWVLRKLRQWFNLGASQAASELLDVLMRITFFLILIAVIFFLVRAVLNSEGRWIFGRRSDKNVLSMEEVEVNIHTTDFRKMVQEAVKQGSYRLAVRYYHLWTLKKLSNAQLIDYDVEKTNSDYFYEIENKELQGGFRYTSYLYNYIWYGEFTVDQQQFTKAKQAFHQFINSITY